jgi:hypothetical protein
MAGDYESLESLPDGFRSILSGVALRVSAERSVTVGFIEKRLGHRDYILAHRRRFAAKNRVLVCNNFYTVEKILS